MDNNDNNNEELSVEEQMEKMQAALDKYKKENEKFRHERDEYKEQVDGLTAAGDKYKNRAIASEAKLRLQKEGIKDTERILNRMDLSSVDFDDEGNVTGLSEGIDSLKNDLPELFDHKKRVGGGADGSSRGDGPTLTPTEQMVRKLYNK